MGRGHQQPQHKSFCAKLCSCAWTLAILGVVGFLFWNFLGRPNRDDLQNFDFGDFTDVLGNFTDFDFGDAFNEDPFVGNNDTDQWRSIGSSGLSLELQNALDDTWTTEFNEAVSDWDNGSPDALTLTTKRVNVDHSCGRVGGVMLVCNGNFGNTGWLGINEVVTQSSFGGSFFITGSVAKMNEYYLLNADYPERLYTMCHEIGHGFGLPHTDENFNNRDLGNCLDYTNTPENNMHPDVTNYNRLKSIYGEVGTRRRALRADSKSESTGSPLNDDLYEAAMEELNEVLHRRHLMQIGEYTPHLSTEWRMLHSHSHGAHFMRSLQVADDEYRIHAHVLFARPDDN